MRDKTDPAMGAGMRRRPVDILLAEEDLDLAELIGRFLNESLRANVTRVETGAGAIREELSVHHQLVLASMSLPDMETLDLVRRLRETNRCPVILMGNSPSAHQAIEALRLGVTDILIRPFGLDHLSSVAQAALARYLRGRRDRARYRRLRRLVARIVCERRDLANRIDLLCRDFVQAHRRLAEKVARSGILTQDN